MNLLRGQGALFVLINSYWLLCGCSSSLNALLNNCSESHGDRPRPLPSIKELKDAPDITTRKGTPAWDYDVRIATDWLYCFVFSLFLSIITCIKYTELSSCDSLSSSISCTIFHVSYPLLYID